MKRAVFGCLFLALAASRFCHLNILWAEEDLPLAAAVQMLYGKALYRDVWFDKPPGVPAIYLLWGAQTGWPLRLAGAFYALAACALIYRFAKGLWREREGLLAASLLGFFLIFGIPAAVMPLAADLLLLAPHIAAVYFAWRGNPMLSGAWAGVGFLFNSKAIFVLAACALWQWRALHWLALGFVIPNVFALTRMRMDGSLSDYWQQVWQLGFVYARSTFLENPIRTGVVRTLNWAGFHIALVLAAAWFWWRDGKSERGRLAGWALLSLAAVAAGWRFFPRYYFQLLPVMTLAAARGILLLGRRRALVLLALAIPLARFGPRYVLLASDLIARRSHQWRDVAMDQDSRAAAARVLLRATPGDTLFVWGYRPELYAYTRLPAGSRFLESQPLTGVFADRHLFQSAESAAPEWARRNREQLARTRPTFVLDGLAAYNPRLAIANYPDLRGWLADYRLVGRTRFTLIYERVISPPSTARAFRETPSRPPARRRPARSSS